MSVSGVVVQMWYGYTMEHYAAINKKELEVLTGEDKSERLR